MPDQTTFDLLIPPLPPLESQNLQSGIQQIIAQKGHFRHVNEQTLLAEIDDRLATSRSAQPDQPAAHDIEDDDTPQKRQERLWKRREEMLERLSYAQNEVLCALDFVSLLISQKSTPAQHSMSQELKKNVPVGSLAQRYLAEKPFSTSTRRQLDSVSQGWRSDGFRSAAKKLGAASSRLQTDAEHEAEYWQQISELTARGWPVSRLPRDRKAIGVHFGFADAAPQFRDRGFALLRQAADGTVALDLKPLSKKRRRLSVRIVQGGLTTGAFHFGSTTPEETTDISQHLTNCRDALFEEELFYEICREARSVANQGIRTRAHAVEIDVFKYYQLSLVSVDETADLPGTNAEDSLTAQFAAVALRLLLNAAHEQNLNKRSRRPPQMTLKPHPTPEYALIRPVLTHLRHRAESRAFLSSCKMLLCSFHQASLPTAISAGNSTATVFETLRTEASNAFLSELVQPAKTGFTLTLTDDRSLHIGQATFLGPPLFGTRFETSPIDFGFCSIPLSRHETREAVTAFIRHVLVLDLVAHAEQLTRRSETGAKVDESGAKEWSVTHPHSGELTLNDTQEVVQRLQLSVRPESIGVNLSSIVKKTTSTSVIWSWTPDSCCKSEGNAITEETNATFDEVVRRLTMDGS